MIIFIDGAQCVGKTYLCKQVSSIVDSVVYYKYDFSKLPERYTSRDSLFMHGISIGKDTQLLSVLPLLYNNEKHIIVDRSFLSTIVYGFIEGRDLTSGIFDYFYYINNMYSDLISQGVLLSHVLINTDMIIARNRGDGFDTRFSGDRDLFTRFFNDLSGCKKYIFNNTFDKKAESNFCDLINRIIYEHK